MKRFYLITLILGSGWAEPTPHLAGQVERGVLETSFTHPDLSLVDDVDVVDGLIFVLDRLGSAAHVFDSQGQRVRTIGREGPGPGELRAPDRMGWLGDTLWIRNPGNQRFNLYSPTGASIGTRELYVRVPTPTRFVSRVAGEWILANGTILGSPEIPWPLIADGAVDSTTFYFIADGAITGMFRRIDISGSVIGINPRGRDFFEHGGNLRPALLPKHDKVVASPDGDLLLVTNMGRYELISFSPGGEIRNQIRVPHAEKAGRPGLTTKLENSVFEDLSGGFRSSFPSEAALREIVRKAIGEPATLPPITHVAAGTDGVVWIRREHSESAVVVWDRIRLSDGERRTTMLPDGFMGMGGDGRRIWGVRLAEHDLPVIEVYSLP